MLTYKLFIMKSYLRTTVLQLLAVLLFTLPAIAQPRIVSTIAGQVPTIPGYDSCYLIGTIGIGGPAHHSTLRNCFDVCNDNNNSIFFCTNDGALRIDAATGILTRFAGGGTDITWSDTIPAANIDIEYSVTSGTTTINYHFPFRGMCMNHAGEVLLANNSIIRVNPVTGYFHVVAGLWPPVLTGSPSYGGDGGPATATNTMAYRLAVDHADNVYFVDMANSIVRRVDAATGIITTIAGDGISSFSGDGGPAAGARFNRPLDIAIDTADNIYIADRDNFRVRKIDAVTGIITTIAGAGGTSSDFSGMGGPATASLINQPNALAFDDTGYLYIAVRHPVAPGYQKSHRILRVDLTSGIISQWGGGIMTAIDPGYPGDGKDVDSAWFQVEGMCFDTAGHMLIADGRCRLRKVWMPIPDGPGPIDTTTDTTGTVFAHTAVAHTGLRVAPNPTRSELHISNVATQAAYTLYTITGLPAAQGILLPQQENTLPLKDYPPGMYLLHIQYTGGERAVVRVLKE